MKTITLEKASSDLRAVINQSIYNCEEVNILSESGSVILIPEEEYEAIKETLRVISDKKSLSALLESHRIREKGEVPESYSVEEVFGDL